MHLIVGLCGAAIVGLSLAGIANPRMLVGWLEPLWGSARGMYLAVAIRVGLGLALLAAAEGSRFPGALWVLGIITLTAAVITPLMGRARIESMVRWWIQKPPGVVRGWAVVGAAFGAFLIIAVL